MAFELAPASFTESSPLGFTLNDIYCIILGQNRLPEDGNPPSPWDACRKINGDVFEFVMGDVERLIERAVAVHLVKHLQAIALKKAEKGEVLKAYHALHILDGRIKEALMGTMCNFFGICSGNSHSTNHMEAFMGMVINEKLRRIYCDLNLTMLAPYDPAVEALAPGPDVPTEKVQA
jgi:hypothetical protein